MRINYHSIENLKDLERKKRMQDRIIVRLKELAKDFAKPPNFNDPDECKIWVIELSKLEPDELRECFEILLGEGRTGKRIFFPRPAEFIGGLTSKHVEHDIFQIRGIYARYGSNASKHSIWEFVDQLSNFAFVYVGSYQTFERFIEMHKYPSQFQEAEKHIRYLYSNYNTDENTRKVIDNAKIKKERKIEIQEQLSASSFLAKEEDDSQIYDMKKWKEFNKSIANLSEKQKRELIILEGKKLLFH